MKRTLISVAAAIGVSLPRTVLSDAALEGGS
jgi:hypothetical protein